MEFCTVNVNKISKCQHEKISKTILNEKARSRILSLIPFMKILFMEILINLCKLKVIHKTIVCNVWLHIFVVKACKHRLEGCFAPVLYYGCSALKM